MQSSHTIDLDVNQDLCQVISVNQYDNESRVVNAYCYKDGVPLEFTDSNTFELNIKTANNTTGHYTTGISATSGSNLLTFTLPALATKYEGSTRLSIDIKEGTTELNTCVFFAAVSKGAYSDSDIEDEGGGRIMDEIEEYAKEAKSSADAASASATIAQTYANSASSSASEAKQTASNVASYVSEAKSYSSAAKGYADTASDYADDSKGYASNAKSYANAASSSASSASESAGKANTYATNSSNSATLSQSWAVGGTGKRSGEDTNNSKYWATVYDTDVANHVISKSTETISSITYDNTTGNFTLIYADSTTETPHTSVIETDLENTIVNFDYDADKQCLILTPEGGGEPKEISLSAFITELEISGTDPINVSTVDHKVTISIPNGAIKAEQIDSAYMVAVIKGTKDSQSYATGDAKKDDGTDWREGQATDNSKYYSQVAESHKDTAAQSEANAKTSEDNAKTSETNAGTSATAAATSESNAAESEANALSYYNSTKTLHDDISGVFSIQKSIAFADLQSQEKAAGYAYVITDDFTTDSTFVNPGVECKAGAIAYYTKNNLWDIFPVSYSAIPVSFIDSLFD